MEWWYTFLFFNAINLLFSQETISDVIRQFNKNTVTYISVEELKRENNSILLDVREMEEYNVSHIRNAIFIGDKHFNKDSVATIIPNKNAKIVVYCSLGVRSENRGEELIKLGYTNVYNLYGGIFEWKNKGNEVVNNKDITTEEVHAFSKMWGKYLIRGIKIDK